MSELKGDAIGPLRTAFTDGLQELLGVSLQMIALALSNELMTVATRPGRAKELAIYVDRWCEIEADAAAITRGFSASGGSSSDTLLLGGSTSAVPAVAVEE